MAANNILPFAQGGGANVPTQAAYVADAQRPLGNQPGVARADFNNKALLQSTLLASCLAQFMADHQGTDISDTLTASAMSALLELSIRSTGGTRSVNGATTLTAADVGQFQLLGSGTPFTVTLPPLSAMKDGSLFRFMNTNGTAVTITRQGTDTIISGSTVISPSIVLQAGDTVDIVASIAIGNWYVVDGSVKLKTANAFGANIAGNGWQRLPSGVIVQWGSAAASPTGATITYPLAWPSTVQQLVATPQSIGSTLISVSWAATATPQTTFSLFCSSGTPQTSWAAIGS